MEIKQVSLSEAAIQKLFNYAGLPFSVLKLAGLDFSSEVNRDQCWMAFADQTGYRLLMPQYWNAKVIEAAVLALAASEDGNYNAESINCPDLPAMAILEVNRFYKFLLDNDYWLAFAEEDDEDEDGPSRDQMIGYAEELGWQLKGTDLDEGEFLQIICDVEDTRRTVAFGPVAEQFLENIWEDSLTPDEVFGNSEEEDDELSADPDEDEDE